jgi:2-succinyl-6-hydroxy-2,4-cyclohexadiene-1-carboxylate synthase
MIFQTLQKKKEASSFVLVHGFLGRPSMWKELIEALPEEANIASATLPGHGPTPWFPAENSFEGAVRQMTKAIPFEAPVHLVGYSLGARVSLALALLSPERVASATLIGVDPGLEGEARVARLAWDEAHAKRVEEIGVDAFAEEWARLPIFATQERLPKEKRAAQQQERREHTTEGIAWAMRHLGLGAMPSWRASLSQHKTPIHFITGSLDTKFTEIAKSMSLLATHTIIEGVGHNVVLEAPDRLAKILT